MSDDEDDYESDNAEENEDVEPNEEDKLRAWFYGLSEKDREFYLQNQKREILDKVAETIEESSEETAITDYIEKPEFQQTLKNYIFALKVVANGFADYFLQTVRRDDKTQTLEFDYEFYKNGKKVEASHIISESETSTAMVEKDEDD